jgi:UPF0716 protein FxsA
MSLLLALLALLALPLLEIAVFVVVGGWIGLWPTLGLVLLSGILGAVLLRAQGFLVLRRAREAALRDELPVAEALDGLCVLLAGVLLILPGFVTDALAILLLLPPVRALLRRVLARNLAATATILTWGYEGGVPPGAEGGQVVEGEFRVIREETLIEVAGNEDRDHPPAGSKP